MYCLEAVLAVRPTLDALVGGDPHARVVPLDARLSLLPMTGELFDSVAVAGAPRAEGFWKLPPGFDRALAACSAAGPLAYVEAEYFGGAGEQNAQVWNGGRVVLGPLHLPEDRPSVADGSPISLALRHLGIDRGDHLDEFDAVGLGRYRRTEDWLTLPEQGL
ncbi:hypothetical protein [Nocardiopsis sp. NRRL B-16309]|uniref:hypothetical protein n=1 Tax=Nocardiopsis sp. NRRL B-16309 TaxID=1519494 RepID=UPI0006AE53EA|nr:hypothetical protein [Nocardiopsis sp. NRRL B-16309]KOX22220.1 hypothetical protein ADL05_04385 [Nocardiopsis sp. NRRL B-16309]